MTPATINTILNTAPMIIQGAGKLIRLIREQSKGSRHDQEEQVSLETLHEHIERLENRLSVADESNIEQIKLIEQLARQNAMLAESVRRLDNRLLTVILVAVIALLASTTLAIYIFSA